MSRNVLLAGVIGAVVAAAGIGWFFGSQIRSPAEIAADAEAPEASNITVEVVRQELSADIITRGDVVYDEPVAVGLSGSFAETPERLVVTLAVEVDSELAEGDVAVEVVGRPVFLLTGEIPMFRDLRPGATGDDVFQLEEALERMGYLSGSPDGVWDEATGAAVAAWYEEAGYRPNGVSAEEDALLKGARDRVRGAEAAVADGESALQDAQRGSGQSGVAAARAELAAAEDELKLARLDADRANELARRARSDAEASLAAADADLARAEEQLSVAEGEDPPPSSDEMEELRQAVASARAARHEAEAGLDQAVFEIDRTAIEQKAFVDAATNRVNVARASLADAQQGIDTTPIRNQIEAARSELAEARQDLEDLQSELGTWLPAGEIVFLRRLPVRVDQVAVSRGSIIESSFITVSGSELALRSSVPERDASRVEEGMDVEIEDPATGEPIYGTIVEKAARAGTHGLASDRVYLEIALDEVPESIVGSNVRVVIPVSSTGGEVLVVPAAALSATADGSTILQVDEGGSLRTVRVETGLAAGGLVEVTPRSGDLSEGDLVVVGQQGRSGAASADDLDTTESEPTEPEPTEPEPTEPEPTEPDET